MKKVEREKACSKLLSALGWINCWFPVSCRELDEDCELTVKAGPLQSAAVRIREVLDQLGHTGGGKCK